MYIDVAPRPSLASQLNILVNDIQLYRLHACYAVLVPRLTGRYHISVLTVLNSYPFLGVVA